MRNVAVALLLLGGLQERRGPIPPAEAVKTFRAPPGFRVELVAAEPDVVSPVAMAFDEDGRLYVAEMRDYPLGTPSGTIRLLEDTHGDGRYDKATLFAENVAFPSGLLCWKGGVFVTCAYEVLYLKDTDGDGKADERRTVFSGFGRQNAQHVVNGLQFGLDNWIYGSNGLSGGQIGGVTLNHSDFRFKPGASEFEPVSGNSQFGNTFDDWGRRFIVRHDCHIVHPVLPQRALRRQPQVSFPAVEEAISDHGNIPRLHPISPRDTVFTTDTDSSCAVTIYRGGAFPPEYGGNAFVCEPVMNLVHRDLIVPRGASFTAKRAEPDREFFASTDPWARPVNLCNGPDGALYVCDMQRSVIEHPDYIPKEIQKKLEMQAGKDCGRIYRVVSESAPAPRRPRLRQATGAGLVAELENPNGWWRTTAQRLLFERQDPGAVDPLRALARDSKAPLGRLHALWALEGLSSLTVEEVARALGDAEGGVREHAIRLAETRLSSSEPLLKALLGRVEDPDPRVRFQLALTLGEARFSQAIETLVRLTVKDAGDAWMRAALLSSAGQAPVDWIAALQRNAPAFLERPEPGALELVRALAQAVAAGRSESLAAAWLRQAAGGDRPRPWQREALSCLGPLRRAGFKVEALVEPLAKWTAAARAASADGARPVAERVEAIGLLSLLADADFAALLSAKEPHEVQIAAIRAMAGRPAEYAGPKLLEGWAGFTAPVRREILSVLFGRAEGVRIVLDRLEKGELRPVEFDPVHRSELLRHPDAAVRNRAKALLSPKGSEEREEVIREYVAKMANLKGDRTRGEKVYTTNCATCHRLAGKGIKVGPDLEGVLGRERQALIVDILDPNRAMDPSYQMYVVRTTANETVNGILATETPAGLTLRRAGGEETTILRRDIAEIKAWPASLMPDGIENNVKPQDLADLLEFLKPPAR
jgi:putative membrane-bound dehydrogenase-like protein